MNADAAASLNSAWSALGAVLRDAFTFYDIKEIAGLAGVDPTRLARLEQKAGGGASKGQLITALDREIGELNYATKMRVLNHIAEEVLSRSPDQTERLGEYLSRLGWQLLGGRLIPIELMDASELAELPTTATADLTKAAARLRDGDLDGALAAACAAVDSSTAAVYLEKGLGSPRKDGFQKRCSEALKAKGTIGDVTDELIGLGWAREDAQRLADNLRGALNHGANVMQGLRSGMSDVHGSKRVMPALVFDSLKWAALIVRML